MQGKKKSSKECVRLSVLLRRIHSPRDLFPRLQRQVQTVKRPERWQSHVAIRRRWNRKCANGRDDEMAMHTRTYTHVTGILACEGGKRHEGLNDSRASRPSLRMVHHFQRSSSSCWLRLHQSSGVFCRIPDMARCVSVKMSRKMWPPI